MVFEKVICWIITWGLYNETFLQRFLFASARHLESGIGAGPFSWIQDLRISWSLCWYNLMSGLWWDWFNSSSALLWGCSLLGIQLLKRGQLSNLSTWAHSHIWLFIASVKSQHSFSALFWIGRFPWGQSSLGGQVFFVFLPSLGFGFAFSWGLFNAWRIFF